MNKVINENLFYIQNGIEQIGPLTFDELKLRNLDINTPIWFEGLNDWTTIGKIDDLKFICNAKFYSNSGFENFNSSKITQSESISNSKNEVNFQDNFLFQKNRKNIALIILMVNIITLIIFTFCPKIFVWGGKHMLDYHFNFILIGLIILLNIIGAISFWRTSIGNVILIIYFTTLMMYPFNFDYKFYDGSQFNIQSESHYYTAITIILILFLLLKYRKYAK